MRQAAVRAVRARARVGKSAPRRQRNERPTRWDTGEFVAIDGEGFSEGDEIETIIEASQTRYVWRAHFYSYIAASDGTEKYAETRLDLAACLDFIFAISQRNRHAIIVAFGMSYDVTQFVIHDLDRDQVRQLIGKSERKGPLIWSDDRYDYALEYRTRKCLTARRWELGARRWLIDDKGRKRATPHDFVAVWDVWGFFQGSFAELLRKWLPGDPDYEFIVRMKGERSIFARSELPEIKKYNAAELRCLVKVMNRVRDALNDLGLKITRWDGAGAVAAAMMQKHKVKRHKAELPPEVYDAARRAYSGGHIEACKLGFHSGAVYHYDITSAYPDRFRDLPSLAGRRWISGVGEPPAGYTLVKIKWSFPHGRPFYPFFYRDRKGIIIYPRTGSGWYWHSEYATARVIDAQCGGECIDVQRWFSLSADQSANRPFSWVEDYSQQRMQFIAAAKRGGFESGPEKIIKLGNNSLYGKTAQQVGARIDRDGRLKLPPFHQLDWAGFVTAGCRAKMMAAALQKPHAIIAFATDGLFSTEPLDLDCPAEKSLGTWEFSKHDGMTIVMPGVYWLHDGDKLKHYSRGFDKKEMQKCDFVHALWREKKERAPIKLSRLIGLGTAVTSDAYWTMRGAFAQSTRSLALNGDNSKRYALNLTRARPHLGLIDTEPRDHDLSNLLDFEPPESAPYPVAWLDGTLERDDPEGEFALERDIADAALA